MSGLHHLRPDGDRAAGQRAASPKESFARPALTQHAKFDALGALAVLPALEGTPAEWGVAASLLFAGLASGWAVSRWFSRQRSETRATHSGEAGIALVPAPAVSASQEDLSALRRAYPGEQFRLDREGTILECAARFSANGKIEVESFVGRSMRDLLSEKYRRGFEETLADVFAADADRTLEYELDAPGQAGLFEARLIPIREGVCMLFARDITLQRKAEEEHAELENRMRQLLKMEALGQLAGGVAHDFNNILTVITGHSQLIREQVGSNEGVLSDLDQIDSAAQKASGLTRQLLAFSRKQILNPEWLDINAIITRMRRILDRLLRDDIELRIDLGTDLWRVHADVSSIEQVLINLAVNAAEAMRTGGSFSIETRNTHLSSEDLVETPHLPSGRYVRITISDTGHGMLPEVRQRAFEPFFTTKSLGRGTGLGLAGVYGIVQKSEGLIRLESECGVGTTFHIFLPATHVPLRELTLSPRSAGFTGRETILLCDDDPGVRLVMRDSLVASGYQVLVAEDPDAAMEIEGNYDDPLHLLVTDVVMAGISGGELSEILRERRPGLRVLYVSGYPHEVVEHHGSISEDDGYLPKPFTPRELVERVRKVLDRGSARIWT